MTQLVKAFVTMVPAGGLPAGGALQLIDQNGQIIGNQIEVKLSQSALTGESRLTVTFDFDGQTLAWWTNGLPGDQSDAGQ